MKDLEKIKEFFLKDRAMTAAYEAKEEYFKPLLRKDKSYPNFLYVDIAYPEGSGVLSISGDKTMSGQDRETGAAKALAMGNEIVKKLEAKYNIEDIEVKDLKNGKVQVFAVSDDFTKMSTPSLNENFPGPGEIVDAKYLNNAMLDYFNRMNIKLLINTKTEKGIKGGVGTMYGDLVFNGDDIKLKDIVSVEIIESSMNEAQEESLYKDWDQFEKPSKIKVYLNNGKTLEISPLKLKGGKRVYDAILQAFIDDRFDITNKVIQGMMNNLSEAKEEDKKFHIQQAKDKYNKLQQAFLKIENPSDSLVKQLEKAEQEYKDLIKPTISEAKKEDAVDTITMDVPLFIRMLEYSREDAAEDMDLHDVTEKAISLGKERGILQMDDYDEIIGTTEKVNESIKRKISEALDKINEELCPKGKAYRQRRIAAGEKSSAYLSGRAVKVCKGQMSGKKKKK